MTEWVWELEGAVGGVEERGGNGVVRAQSCSDKDGNLRCGFLRKKDESRQICKPRYEEDVD